MGTGCMSIVQALFVLFALLAVVALAALANRVLGIRLDRPETEIPPTAEEQRWLDELAVLELERRHPVC